MNKVPSSQFPVASYKRILIVRLDRIGDVLLSTPAIKAVREAFPDSHIAVMVRPYAKDIIEGNPYINEVIVYDKEGPERSLAGNFRFIMKLRKMKFDLALALHPTNRTHLIIALAGISRRVGYDKKLGWLLTKKIPHTKQFGLKHEIDYALDIVRQVGVQTCDRALFIALDDESEKRISNIFKSVGINDGDLVVTLNPSASCLSKRWPAERFAGVADILSKRYKAKVVIISAIKDQAVSGMVISFLKEPCLDLTGKTSVKDLASVLKRSSLLISNDSGPVHIACAVKTPVIAIFGRSDRGLSPLRWGPTGNRDIVLHKDVGCDVCLAHKCKIGFKCLDAISVEEAASAAARILGL